MADGKRYELRYELWVMWNLPLEGRSEKLEGVFPSEEAAYKAANTFRPRRGFWSCHVVKRTEKTRAVGWSRERPTEPGWYWFYGRTEAGGSICLDAVEVEFHPSQRLIVWQRVGACQEVLISEGWWLPLTPPEPPHEEGKETTET